MASANDDSSDVGPEHIGARRETVKPERESDNFVVFSAVDLGLFEHKHNDDKTLAIFEALLGHGFVPVYVTISADYPSKLYCLKADLFSALSEHAPKTIPCGDAP